MSKKVLSLLLAVILLMGQFSISVSASAMDDCSITREYLSDGSYYETKIEYGKTRSTITGASKTTTYRNSAGVALWYVRVKANFTFNGSSSSCTSSSCSAESYSSSWKIISRDSSRSGNTAYAKAKAAQYMPGALVGTKERTVSITCDKNGNVF